MGKINHFTIQHIWWQLKETKNTGREWEQDKTWAHMHRCGCMHVGDLQNELRIHKKCNIQLTLLLRSWQIRHLDRSFQMLWENVSSGNILAASTECLPLHKYHLMFHFSKEESFSLFSWKALKCTKTYAVLGLRA